MMRIHTVRWGVPEICVCERDSRTKKLSPKAVIEETDWNDKIHLPGLQPIFKQLRMSVFSQATSGW
jgi:hypothetical protein